ncbi:MAG: hypothetical protein B6U89_06210 [Desulfurococcales archaeon ex4484_58]|nr:MAG: hypothetical protein B6U89_06210 [Desulfurococcales archaeon ex4484_58]
MDPNNIVKLAKTLQRYEYNKDYIIECDKDKVLLTVNRKELIKLLEKIHYNELLDKIYQWINSNRVCITPGIHGIDEIKLYEYELAIIIYNLLKCQGYVDFKVFLDDLSDKTLLFTYIYRILLDRDGEIIEEKPLDILVKYVFTLFEFKEIRDRLKELERELEIKYSSTLYQEYELKLRELDTLMPMIKDLWLGDREFFDLINDIILSIDKDRGRIINSVKKTLENYYEFFESIHNKWIELYRKVSDKYSMKPEFIFLSKFYELHSGLDLEFGEKLRSIYEYLDRMGYNMKIVVNGEEYLILTELSNLDFIVLIV